jgi:hypothetical protein
METILDFRGHYGKQNQKSRNMMFNVNKIVPEKGHFLE